MLSSVPVFFLVLWSYEVLNVNLKAWFTNPVDNQVEVYKKAAWALDLEIHNRLRVQAALLAAQPETGQVLAGGQPAPDALQRFATEQGLESAAILSPLGSALATWGPYPARAQEGHTTVVHVPLKNGAIELGARIPLDAGQQLLDIKKFSDDWAQIVGNRKDYRTLYVMLMVLITLFVLFVATWLARILANRISTPITAILEAADEVRRGNLQHRVTVRAEDELALLVTGFNQMTEALESSGIELDRRRRFTEAILESIPTGVISIGPDGSIQHVNQALAKIFPSLLAAQATRLEDLFSREDTTEIKYLMKRARRTGVASRQLELRTDSRKIHLAVTVSALESKLTAWPMRSRTR
jgi:nitrogen fixation/metabolism regulation signal transduction histidine kinase